jgi:ribonuclease HI
VTSGVIAFTDGGCRGNPGPGGWAFLLVDPRTHAALERHGGEAHTTNNRMEMLAAIRALEAVKGAGARVEVRSDSRYLVDMCTQWLRGWKAKGWRRGPKGKEEVLNLDLVKRLDELIALHDVRWTWVRGHAGDPGNEHVDRLTNQAMDLLGQGKDPSGEARYPPGESPVRVTPAHGRR